MIRFTILSFIILLTFSVFLDRRQPVDTLADYAAAVAIAEQKPVPPRPFSFDGCTLFPDQMAHVDLTEACLVHDIQYWLGGTDLERKAADKELRYAVTQSSPLVAQIMYLGTRLFGNSLIAHAVGAQWGFGWDQ